LICAKGAALRAHHTQRESMMINAMKSGLLAAAAALACAHAGFAQQTEVQAKKPPYKILYVMSYHSPWRWTDGQLDGFKEGMAGVPAEYKVFQMDTKQNSTRDAKERKGREARTLIESWKPDLVYTSDDDVQEYVAVHYIGKDLPFVFSGVNKTPQAYGFSGSKNITGVLEQEHFVESVRLLQSVAPGVKRIVAVFDDAQMWEPVVARMRERVKQLPGVEIVQWDTIRTWTEFQQKMRDYPSKADAVALIGIFNFKDAHGKNVPYQEVLRWTAENSKLPDLGFWVDRVHFGTLAAVTVSEREQGLAAGRIARQILVDGKAPSSFAMIATTKGIPVISLARANKLGLKVKSSVLLSAEVIERFEWEQK
jgi:ABC-type uncharacterized transport system substrate-binding protein